MQRCLQTLMFSILLTGSSGSRWDLGGGGWLRLFLLSSVQSFYFSFLWDMTQCKLKNSI